MTLRHFTRCLVWLLAVVLLALSTDFALAEEQTATVAPQETAFQQRIRAEQEQLLAKDVPQVDSLAGQLANGLTFCAAVFFLGLALAKRFRKKQGDNGSNIQIISRQALSSKSALIVVEVEGKRLLLAESTEQLSLLGNMDEPHGLSREIPIKVLQEAI